jgi:hypothetical protein
VSTFREHVAGPLLQNALLCSRCGEVLFTADWQGPDKRRWPKGARVASNGEGHSYDVTGWPYTPCEPWTPKTGERPQRHEATP